MDVSANAKSWPNHAPLRRLTTALRRDVAEVVASLAEDLMDPRTASAQIALHGLDRLRRSLGATDAVFWIIDDARADPLLRAGAAAGGTMAALGLEVTSHVIERLRRNRAVLCRSNEVAGVEDLVPTGARSFAVVAAVRGSKVSSALVFGWTDDIPQCDEIALAQIRVATALIEGAMTGSNRGPDVHTLADAILASLPDRIAVVNRQGAIIAANPAWREAAGSAIGRSAIGPGMSYSEAYARAAAESSPGENPIVRGIESVLNGASPRFETVDSSQPRGDEPWSHVTAMPLRHPDGGVVITHVDVTHQQVLDLAARMGEGLFSSVTEALPIPVWLCDGSGRLIHGNRSWLEAAGAHNGHIAPDAAWTDACHPDDREPALTAFRAAVGRREPITLDLRVRSGDGAYRWSECVAAPCSASIGNIEYYVGLFNDATAKHRAEIALGEITAKLIIAQESERSRIARELHDDLGQQVALLASRLEGLLHEQPLSTDHMDAVRESLRELATSIHDLSHRLHPAKLRLLGLAQTLEILCRDVAAESHLPVAFDHGDVPADLDDDIALCAYRVAQEALQNAVKHSGARTLELHIGISGDRLILRIRDDGSGFDRLSVRSTGLGLLTMAERVDLAGGTLRVAASPQGTTIDVDLPIVHRATPA